MRRRTNHLVISALTLLLLGVAFVSPSAHAVTYSSDIGVSFTFNTTLKVSLSNADLIISNLIPGTVSDSNIITVNAGTNNATGLTMNATVGNSTDYNNRNLTHTSDTITSNFSSVDFGSSLSSLTTDNTWGYSYSTDNQSTWSSYSGLPLYSDTTNIATLLSTSGRSTSATGDAINFKIAAKASATQDSGEYRNVINFMTVANPETPPCPGNTVCYNDNGASSPTTMGNQVISSGATIINLWPSNFQRAGYGFAGWNTKKDGSGTSYGPMETIDAPSEFAASGLTLYAMWVAPPATNNTLQGWTGCSTMSTGQVTALTDTRDNNTYAVAKLADGNCWMIENLRLGGSSAMNLTTANTVTAFTLPASTNTFTTSNYTTIEMSAKNTLEASADMTTPTNAEVYSYGNYYSWPAAIGSTTAYSTNNQSVSTSICPSGWHLPKGGDKNNTSNSEFWKLIVTGLNNGTNPANYSSQTYPYYTGDPEGVNVSKLVRSYPNNFLYSGYLSGSSFNGRGSYGYYWSSSVSSSGSSYSLYLYSTTVYPGTYYNVKYLGFSVRCVAGS